MSKIEFRAEEVDTNKIDIDQWNKIQELLKILVDERYDISIHYIGDGVIGIDWEPAYFPKRNLVWVETIDDITDGAAAQLSEEEKEKLYGEEWNPKPIHFNDNDNDEEKISTNSLILGAGVPWWWQKDKYNDVWRYEPTVTTASENPYEVTLTNTEEQNSKPVHLNEGSLNITTTLNEPFNFFDTGWQPTDEFVTLVTDKDIDMMIDEFNQPTAAEKGEM